MRIRCLLFTSILLLLPVTSWADILTVASPYGAKEVVAAISSASAGDIVEIPAGVTAAWSSTITINKAITLRGASGTQPIITRNLPGSTKLINIAPSTDIPIRVSNLTFKNSSTPGRTPYAWDIYV